jgi:predicted DNA-binding protein
MKKTPEKKAIVIKSENFKKLKAYSKYTGKTSSAILRDWIDNCNPNVIKKKEKDDKYVRNITLYPIQIEKLEKLKNTKNKQLSELIGDIIKFNLPS